MNKSFSTRVRYGLAYVQAGFFTLLFSNMVWLPYAHAGPEGGTVTGGSGTINQTGNTTNINQNSQNMAINWDSYNVNSNEIVNYVQPNSSSISLNRILSNNGSEIYGQINANGHVILINPHGIHFGAGAAINVGGIVASTLDMTPTDFMNGNYALKEYIDDNGNVINGSVVNSGIINAAIGGNVALIGKKVKNDGLIMAKLGSVSLAAGKEAVLTFDNQGLLGVKVTKAVLQDEIGVDPAVLNSGDILAEGGRVLLTASTSQDVFSQAVNTRGLDAATSVVVHDDGTFTLGGGADVVNTGRIDASNTGSSADNVVSAVTRYNDKHNTAVIVLEDRTVENLQSSDGIDLQQTSHDNLSKNNTVDELASTSSDGGRIVLLGENVTSSGSIRADSDSGNGGEIELHANDTTLLTENSITSARSEANGKGGIVKVLGDKVGLFDQSIVDVSGANGGGTALIGGDRQGLNQNIRNANFTYISEGSQIRADALDNGNGGKIITFANNTTRVHGGLFARGGVNGGDGGFIETSGLKGFVITSVPDASAYVGNGGEWLIDPSNIKIVNTCSTGAPLCVNSGGSPFEPSIDNTEIEWSIILQGLTNNDVTISTANGTGTQGDISFETGNFNYNGVDNNKLTLQADRDIIFKTGSSIFDSSLSDGNGDRLSFELNAVRNVSIEAGVTLITGGGDFVVGTAINRVNSFSSLSTIDTSGIDRTYIPSTTIVDSGTRSENGGKVEIYSDTNINTADIDTRGGLRLGSNSSGRDGGNVLLDGVDVTVGKITTSGSNGIGSGSRNGGNAGTIKITATQNGANTPSITLNGNIEAKGGQPSGGSVGATQTAQLKLIGAGAGLVKINHTTNFTTAVNIIGNAGTSTLEAANRANTWTIDGGTSELLNTNVSFSSFEVLTGNAGVDTFNITSSFSGTLNGGDNADIFNINTAGVTVTNINGDAGDDTLKAANEANTWDITTDDGGTLNTNTTFSSIQHIVGNGGVDTFKLGADITGSASGMGNNDVFEISSNITGNLNGNNNDDDFKILATGLSIAAMNGDAGNDRLYAANEANTWAFSAPNTGSINGDKGFGTIENLFGGTDIDTFNLTQDVTGSVNGGDNADVFNISLSQTGVLNGDNGNDDFNITASVSVATINGGAGADDFNIKNTGALTGGILNGNAGADIFTIEGATAGTLNGGANDDTFNIASSVTGTINGDDNNDTFNIIAGNNITGIINGNAGVDTFAISAAMATGTLSGGAGNDIFTISALMGGTLNGGNNNDQFNINSGSNITGAINGDNNNDVFYINTGSVVGATGTINGGNGNDDFNIYANVAGALNGDADSDDFRILATGLSIAAMNGNAGNDRLYAANEANTWAFSASNTGSINGDKGFGTIENLFGGTDIDTFNLTQDVTGSVNGGDNADVFNISLSQTGVLNGDNGNDDFNITASVSVATINGGAGADDFNIKNTGALTGGILNGNAGADIFTIEGATAGTLNGGANDDTFTIASSVTGTINGDDNNDTFNIIAGNNITGIINGNAGIDTFAILAAMATGTLSGGAGNDIFTISALMGGTLNGGNNNDQFNINSGSNITGAINGDNNNDVFYINTGSLIGATGTINGGNGNDDFNIYENVAGALNGDADSDTFDILAANLTIATMDGGTGGTDNDTFTAFDESNYWYVSGQDGKIYPTAARTAGTHRVDFKDMENLFGGTGIDEFQIDGSLTATITDLGSNSDAIDFSLLATVTLDLGAGGYTGFEKFIGNNTDSTLIGRNNDANWRIITENDGTVTYNSGTPSEEVITFVNFNNLTGGDMSDQFVLENTGSLTGMLLGGNASGVDTLDIDKSTAITVQLGNIPVVGPGIKVDQLETIEANNVAGNTLKGFDDPNNWLITSVTSLSGLPTSGIDSGIVNGINFINFSNLTGGDAADTFVIASDGRISGTISGGAIGSKTDTRENLLIGKDGVVNDWRITANNAGNLRVYGSTGTYVGNFNNIFKLQGGDSRDIFTLASGVYVTDINGVGLDNELRIANGRTWTVDGNNSGYIDLLSNNRTFRNIQNLTGLSGASAGQDRFIFTSSGSLSGLIDGGGANNDEVDMSALSVVDVAIGEDVTNVERIIGNSPDNSGNSTITADAGNNEWVMTGVNSGTINSTIKFENFNNITGGGNNDKFTFNIGSWITGQILGGGGSQDIIDIASLLVNPTLTPGSDDIVVQLGLAVSTDTSVLNIHDIDTVNASATANNTLRGDDAINIWQINTSIPANYNEGYVTTGGATTNFTNFHHFIGGNQRDSFTVAEGANAKTISGGDLLFPNDANDTIDFGAGASISVGTEIKSGTIGLSNIEGVKSVGGTLSARSGVTTNWDISGNQIGTVNDTGGASMSFEGFTTLNGGDGVDNFTVSNGGTYTGVMSGNGGNDTFTLNSGGTFSGTMNGNADDDTFTINSGSSFNGDIFGHANNDELSITLSGTENHNISFHGGSDINMVTVDGNAGGSTYAENYNPDSMVVPGYDQFKYQNASNGSEVNINLAAISTINDNVTANLSVNSTSQADALTLTSATYYVDNAVNPNAVNYTNKPNITVAGASDDTVNIGSNLNLDSLTLRGGIVNSNGFNVAANDLIFNEAGTTDTFNTNITNLTVLNSGSVTVRDGDSVNLAALNTTGAVDIGATALTSNGGLISSGALTVSAASIDLFDPANGNQLSGALDLRGGDIRLNNTAVTDLAYIDALGDLLIESTADINGSGPVMVDGDTTLTSSADIILDNAGNNFTTVTANGRNVTVRDADSLSVNITATEQAEVIAGDRINSGSLNANRVVLTAQNGIGTTGTSGVGGTAINTVANFLNVHNTTGGVNISNNGSVFVEALKTVGDIDFRVDGDLTVREINADYDTGDLNMTVTGSVFGDPNKPYTIFPADITAYNALLFIGNSFGTQARPISVRVKNNFTLFSTQSAVYYLGGQPRFLNDQSDVKLKVLDALSGLSGQQLIEVESLAEIDPAIFTEVRNYYYEDLAIMMPDDQLYSDEEEEKRRRMSER